MCFCRGLEPLCSIAFRTLYIEKQEQMLQRHGHCSSLKSKITVFMLIKFFIQEWSNKIQIM